MLRFDTVIVSDLHLGARNARCDDFLEFLQSVDTRRLIFNGDLFQDPRLRNLRDCDIEVVEALRHRAQFTRVDWLVGNHDPGERWLSSLLGLEGVDELTLDLHGRRYLVCHGHRWDRSVNWPSYIVGAGEAIYSACQWIDPSHRLAKFLKHKSKWFCRAVNTLKRCAVRAARERRLDGVILGHTHVAFDGMVDGVHYLNSGCWTERPNAFVGIRGGEARTYHWLDGMCLPLHEVSVPTMATELALDDGSLVAA